MAKQSGIHQLRGKVGEHSYYKQTGVESGLVRSINQGLSERVKMSEEYANTRLNNAEFGQAGRIAKVLGQFITPKYRPMILPFSQSKMCKMILESIKNDKKVEWGKRNISEGQTGITLLINTLNSVRKNNPDSYGVSVSTNEDKLRVHLDDTLCPAKMLSIGASGYDIRVIAAAPWIGSFFAGEYGESFARANFYDGFDQQPGNYFDVDFLFRPIPPKDWPAFRLTFGIVIILPYREVNGTKYTLQEHCTYFAFDTPEE